jgi:RND family efflux transporter MFP subunit
MTRIGIVPLARLGLIVGLCIGLGGCSKASSEGPGVKPPTVTVSYPIRREVRDYEEYTGRTAAVDSVQVRARVSGYLQKINFKEGAEVKEGAVLFEIDPRPYQAVFNQARAQVRLQEAQLAYNEAVYKRDLRLFRNQAISEEELQQAETQRNTSRASVNAAKANLETARLNLGWTKVTAPIDGRASRTLVTRGNLVTADSTILTTIVSQDPMYVYFDVDEPTALRVQQLIREGKVKSVRAGAKVPVFLGLTTEKDYPHEGELDFVNNQVDPTTATLQIRGVFENPKPPVGYRLLSAGLFVRVRVPIGAYYRALLVNAEAILMDQDLRFVYVLDGQNQVVRRNVTLGSEHDGLTVITEGLRPRERVVVDGIQHVRPGMTVKPRLVPMPEPPKRALPRAQPPVLNTPVPLRGKR